LGEIPVTHELNRRPANKPFDKNKKAGSSCTVCNPFDPEKVKKDRDTLNQLAPTHFPSLNQNSWRIIDTSDRPGNCLGHCLEEKKWAGVSPGDIGGAELDPITSEQGLADRLKDLGYQKLDQPYDKVKDELGHSPDTDRVVIFKNNNGGVEHGIAQYGQSPIDEWESKMGIHALIGVTNPDQLAGPELGKPTDVWTRPSRAQS
jgi:hypothetical protein